MPQDTDTKDSQLTVPIPEEIISSIEKTTPEEQTAKSKKKAKKSHSTTVTTALDRIFSQEERQSAEVLSIHADSSLDFRRSLELSGKKYKIEKLMATGGFGRIFQVQDRVLGRKAVVKSLKEEYLNDTKAVEHFIAEAKLNSQLDHPGIVPLFSLDTDTNQGLHLAMQRVTGISLKVYLERSRALQQEHRFSQKIYNRMLTERLELFLHICNTISYCHDRGILHNDLKPDNIMIGKHGQVYVMDWGLACIADGEKPEQNIGSPAYMAPERLSSRVLSRQTDIFALGMILNELVTLRPSIEGTSVSDIVQNICTGQFVPSTCIDPKRSIPAVLRAIIEKARDPNPNERYASVQELSEDIHHFLFKEETSAYPDSFFQMILRFLFHHRNFSMALLAFLFLLFLANAGYNFINAAAITQRAHQETVWKLNLAKSVETKSEMIGKQLLLLQEQTSNMGSALAIEYGKKLYDTNAPFYWNENFAPGSKKRPPGLIHTVASKGKSISLATGTFYLLQDQINPQEIQDWANNFRAQQSQHLATVLSYTRKKDTAGKSDKMNSFYEYGSIVQRIICVLDNGLVYSYPGKYEPAASVNEFIPDGVRQELRSGKEFIWSSPYVDPASGLIVISSWNTISSLRGNKIGVIGMVVIYKDILNDFLTQINQEKGHAVYTLVDSEARLIYSSADEFALYETNADASTEGMIGHHSYKWYSEVIRRIREKPAQSQFTAVLNGTPFNITWKQIPSSNWLLIQHVALKHKP